MYVNINHNHSNNQPIHLETKKISNEIFPRQEGNVHFRRRREPGTLRIGWMDVVRDSDAEMLRDGDIQSNQIR